MNDPKVIRIASIVIGTIIAIGLIVMGFRLFSSVFTRAADFEPRDVVVSNINKNSVTVSWATGVETQGVIEYGTTPTALNFFAPEPQKTRTHSLDLTLLSPTTTYYFQIRIGDKKYDNGGVPWTFTTKATATAPANLTPTTGNATPTPVQTIVIPVTGTQACNYTDCQKIKSLLGKGCSTQDYFRCVRKLTPTTTP